MSEPILVGDRKVYPVAAFNARLRGYLRRVRGVWVEGEVSGLRRNEAWATVFLTLKGADGSSLRVQVPRRRYDALELGLTDGEQVHVRGDVDLYEARGELVFRATEIERVGRGAHLVELERLRQALAAEGLFAVERKRPLPRFPRAVGLLTGVEAAARGDVVAAIAARFPAARLVVAETRVQGPQAPRRIARALCALAEHPAVDVVIVARGGGSLEDLLPFSDEHVVRAVAACPVPVVSAVGHEQDTPLCDLAADVRAATPTAAARLVVPDAAELRQALAHARARIGDRARGRVERGRDRTVTLRARLAGAVERRLERERARTARQGERLSTAPRLLLERRRATLDTTGARLAALSPLSTLERGYAVVRARGTAVRDATAVVAGDRLEIELAAGGLAATVEEVIPG